MMMNRMMMVDHVWKQECFHTILEVRMMKKYDDDDDDDNDQDVDDGWKEEISLF